MLVIEKMLPQRVTPILTAPFARHVGPGLVILRKDFPHGVLSLAFLQEAKGFMGEIEEASILSSGEFWAPHSFKYKESSTMPGTFLGG